MTGGMAFIYDPENHFDKKVNPESVVWQTPETKFWIEHLKQLIQLHALETTSLISKKIIKNFENEINNFVQVCPKEMLDKLENPISIKKLVVQAS